MKTFINFNGHQVEVRAFFRIGDDNSLDAGEEVDAAIERIAEHFNFFGLLPEVGDVFFVDGFVEDDEKWTEYETAIVIGRLFVPENKQRSPVISFELKWEEQ